MQTNLVERSVEMGMQQVIRPVLLLFSDRNDAPFTLVELLRSQFTKHEILSCVDIKEVLAVADSRLTDGIIFDFEELNDGTLERCRELKAVPTTHRIPLMILSHQKNGESLRKLGIEAGADDVLRCPVEDDEIVARINSMLRIKSAEDKQLAATKRIEELVAEHNAEMHSSEERYGRLVELSPNMIVVCTEGRTTFINQAGRDIMRAKNVADLIGKSIFDFVHSDSLEQLEGVISSCLELGKKTSYVEMLFRSVDGRTIDVETAAVPFEHQGRKHVQLVVKDITERKELAQRIRQSQRMEAVGQLAGGVSHDFNNILTTIRGYSELVLEGLNVNDPMVEDVQEIHKATARAAALTRQLLAFSRRQVLQAIPLDLNTVVVEMKRMLQRLIGEHIDLVTDLSGDLGTIRADCSQIEQVIMNLAVNARDAIEGVGTLTVKTRNRALDNEYESMRVDLSAGEYVLLEVSDTGVGMSQDTAFRIFEPFFTTKAKDKGTGLGLSTVYGIVKQSGGDIVVDSQEGAGTVFKIYLPIISESVIPPQETQNQSATAKGSETILLVEDDDSVRFLAKRMLERAGYKVIQARNGAEALNICERHSEQIHLILTDLVMPEMGGRELVEQLLGSHPGMRTLVMSGYADGAMLELGEILSGAEILKKPFSYVELIQTVRSVLDAEN